MSELLAKSGGLSLQQHSLDVANVAQWMYGTELKPTRLAKMWLRFFDIPIDQFPFFWINLVAASATHDWGKANSGFLGMLQNKNSQAMYHEHISGLLLAFDDITLWLKRRTGIDSKSFLLRCYVITCASP